MSYLSLGNTNDENGDFMGMPGGGRGVIGGGNSNLSSLFGLNNQMNNNPNSNQSLTYTAPKPPGKSTAQPAKQQQQPPSTGPSVAIAVAVTAYRYVNNQNVKQGKLGAALLKNAAAKDYKILMYVTKQQPVSTSQISPSFQFTIQANNYATFADDQRQTWTVLFDSSQQLTDFAKQVCLAKYFSNPESSNICVTQDLTVRQAQAPSVETGDSLEMKYTGWLVNQDGSLGAVFDSNHSTEKTFRFKTGRGKVIKGWESGMLGMQKGGKRFLIIPPHLAYGQKSVENKVPANSTLSFEVDLLRMKQSKDTSSVKSGGSVESLPQAVAIDTPPPNPVADLPQDNNVPIPTDTDDLTKGRTASLTDQISNLSNDPSKNPLLSRMARMGQAMLPMTTPKEAPSDQPQPSDLFVQNQQPISIQQAPAANVLPEYTRPLQPATPPQPAPQLQQHIPPQQQVQSLPQQMQSQYQTPSHQFHPQHNVMANNLTTLPQQSQHPPISQNYMDRPVMSSYAPPTSDPSSTYNSYSGYRQMPSYPLPHGYGSDFMPVLVSESRQQSSELRLLQEKVDKVSNMVEEVKKNTSESNIMQSKSSSQVMDAATIMRNVQRIMEENEKLKETVVDKDKQISGQSEKISDLLQQNQKHVERSNMMLEQRNDSFKESFNQSQARSLQLEQDKVDLTQRLSDATSKVSELTLEVSNAKQREGELKQKFKEIYMKEKERAEDAEEKVKELEEELSSATEKEKAFSSSDEVLKSKISELNQQISHLNDVIEKEHKEQSEQLASCAAEKRELESRLNQTEVDYASRIEEMQSNAKNVDLVSAEHKTTLAAVEAKLQEAQENSETNLKKVELLQQKYTQVRSAYEEQKEKLQEALDEVEESSAYKEAYDRLRNQASSMKEKYEAKIVQLQEELEQQADNEGAGSNPTQVVDEVKKIMNTIFQRVRARISSDEDYSGSDVLRIMLEIIKSTTLSLLESNKKESEDEKDVSSDDDDDEEEESEEDTDAEDVKTEEVETEKDKEVSSVETQQQSSNAVSPVNDPIEKEEDTNHSVQVDEGQDTVLDDADEQKSEVSDHATEKEEKLEENETSPSQDEGCGEVAASNDEKLKENDGGSDETEPSEQTATQDPGAGESNDSIEDSASYSEDNSEQVKLQEGSSDPLTTPDLPTMHCDEGREEEVEENAPDTLDSNGKTNGVEEEEKNSPTTCESLSRSSSVLDSRQPPPLFDDDTSDDDNWLK